jgi:DNA replicative helicase MCM subunit Mcm2 (Cdc46/Mcm family)
MQDLSDTDRADILKLSRDPHIGEKIVRSFAPSIYGNDHVKMAVMLALFGGCPKVCVGGTHIVLIHIYCEVDVIVPFFFLKSHPPIHDYT